MKIAAFTLIDSVMQRWAEIFKGKYEFIEVDSIAQLKKLFTGKETVLFLIHRSIAEKDIIARLCSLPTIHKIFIFSDQPNKEEGLLFLEKGAIGYANTYMTPALLLQAVEVVLSGRVWIGQKLMNELIHTLHAEKGKRKVSGLDLAAANLTERETEIAGLIGKGLTNLEIAEQLGISERTVKAHLSSIYRKTNVQGRLQLALSLQ